MIAGGSGITPFYQLCLDFEREMKTEGSGESSIPHLTLLYFNKTEQDILLKEELSRLKKEGVLKELAFFVDKNESSNKEIGTGPINQEIISNHLPKVFDNKHKVFYCGNNDMNSVVMDLLNTNGFKNFFKY
jgi:NAD(P)H-flavin reductase